MITEKEIVDVLNTYKEHHDEIDEEGNITGAYICMVSNSINKDKLASAILEKIGKWEVVASGVVTGMLIIDDNYFVHTDKLGDVKVEKSPIEMEGKNIEIAVKEVM